MLSIGATVLLARPGWAGPPAESLIRSGTPDEGDRRVGAIKRRLGVSPGVLLVRPGRSAGSAPFASGSSAAASVVQSGGGSGSVGDPSGAVGGLLGHRARWDPSLEGTSYERLRAFHRGCGCRRGPDHGARNGRIRGAAAITDPRRHAIRRRPEGRRAVQAVWFQSQLSAGPHRRVIRRREVQRRLSQTRREPVQARGAAGAKRGPRGSVRRASSPACRGARRRPERVGGPGSERGQLREQLRTRPGSEPRLDFQCQRLERRRWRWG
jgi:hypothetical protein